MKIINLMNELKYKYLLRFLRNTKNIKSACQRLMNLFIFKAKSDIGVNTLKYEDEVNNMKRDNYLNEYSKYEEFFQFPLNKKGYPKNIHVKKINI